MNVSKDVTLAVAGLIVLIVLSRVLFLFSIAVKSTSFGTNECELLS